MAKPDAATPPKRRGRPPKNKPTPAPQESEEKKSPKQARLPGTEDARLEGLEKLAYDYADKRDKRMAIQLEEVELKTQLIAEMHKLKRTTYRYSDVKITLTVAKEKIKVEVGSDPEDET